MHINFQTYRTIKRTLAHTLHTRRNSHQEQHLNTLALLICGIVGAQHVQFAPIADHAPIRGQKNESLITRFRRFVKHDDITLEAVWLPFARAVLVLGDGEFYRAELQAAVRAAKWDFACRTASNITIYAPDRVFTVWDLP